MNRLGATIEVFSKSDCPYCTEIKEFLTEQQLEFTETRIDDPAARTAFYDEHHLTGQHRTMPQVYVSTSETRIRLGSSAETKVSGITSLRRLQSIAIETLEGHQA